MASRFIVLGKGLTFELVSVNQNNSINQAVYPFAGVNMGAGEGPAGSTLRRRTLVAAVGGGGGTGDSTISSITQSGNAMTLGAKTLNVLPNNTVPPMAFAWRFPTFPDSTTGDFSVTFSNASADRCTLYVMRIMESIHPQFDSDVVEEDSGTLNSQQNTLDCLNGGLEVYLSALGTADAANANMSFSRATRIDNRQADAATCIAMAVRRSALTESAHVETVTWPGAAARAAMISATFR